MERLRGRVILPDATLPDGIVEYDGATITRVAPVDRVEGPLPPSSDDLLVPGLVDIHCHGGGGTSFPDIRDGEEAMVAVREHRAHGTTTLVASLVTAPGEVLLASTQILASLADAGELAGIHHEGPFISAGHPGAQDPAAIRDPDPVLTADLLAAGRGHVVSMTIAPETPGAAEVATLLVEGGAVPSWGHTSASAAEARATLLSLEPLLARHGRRATVTHLYNGMAPPHHREPGPVLEFLAAARQGRLVVELIGDGVHLHPDTVRATWQIVGRDNAIFVTDAMAAAGMADGDHVLGGLAVRVRDGVARLAEGGALAGGTAHLIDILRTSVRGGVPLVDAVAMAATTPAAVLSRTDVGRLVAGARADVLVLDPDLGLRRVLRGGRDVA
ncbi:MAG: N-acetylglucosamine-6-phosphate deacetylase [Actinomycetota bacterium]